MKSKVRHHRVKSHLTQSELAKLTGLTQSRISEIENGVTKYLRLETVAKLCAVLDADIDDLFEVTI